MIYTEGIQSWFDFADFYDRVATMLPSPCAIAELGVWRGGSVLHLAARLREFGKESIIYAVDTFKGSPEEAIHAKIIAELPCTLFEDFIGNVNKLGLRQSIVTITGDSICASTLLSDVTLDFIFFDSAHTRTHLLAEIQAWLPKLKSGCMFAGHDIDWEGIQEVVRSIAPQFQRDGSCWKAIKP